MTKMRSSPPIRGRLAYVFLGIACLGGGSAASACGRSRDNFEEQSDGAAQVDASAPEGSNDPGFADASSGSCGLARATADPLGCEYLLPIVQWAPPGVANCVPLLVSNPGQIPAHLRLEWAGQPVDLGRSARIVGAGRVPSYEPLDNNELPPGATAVIALLQGLATTSLSLCPIPAVLEDIDFGKPRFSLGLEGTGRSTAPTFHLSSSEPVLATTMHTYNLWSDDGQYGSVLRSVESWTAEYLDVGVFQPGRPLTGRAPPADPSFTALVAREATTIDLATDAGKRTITLKPYESFRITQDDRFIGTRIIGDRPFGAFAGSPAVYVPFNFSAGDSVLYSYASPAQWGSEYAVARYPNRRSTFDDPAVVRILAKSDNTVLAYEPATPAGAPTVLAAGELAIFSASAPFVVRSQDGAHPFHVSILMTSFQAACTPDEFDASYADCRGDPELLGVPPPAEYANRFAFLADHTFPDTYLVVIRRKSEAGAFADVTLDCAGTLTGWSPIGSSYETTTIALSSGSFEPQRYAGGTCQVGPHVMHSTGLFTAMVWGWDHKGDVFEPNGYATQRSYGFSMLGLRDRPDAGPNK